MVGNDGDDHKRYLNKAVLHHHRYANGKDLAKCTAFRLEVRTRKVDAALTAQDHDQRDEHADQLRKSGTQRCTGRAKMQRAHEQIIQRNVACTGHRNKVHRAFGIAQPAEDRCHDIIRRDAWNADKADDQVGTSARHGLLRCGDNAYDRIHKPYQHSCQYHRSCHKQRDCVANEPRRTRFVLCAHGPANSDRCSHGKAHDHHSDHMHHLTANGHRRCAGHTFKLPDDEQIRHAVQRLQKVRKQIGQ